jgi:hypothetical protein
MTTITLNRHEMRTAAMGGIERRLSAIAKNRPAFYGADTRQNEWQIDIIGAIGEYAVAKYLNVYWEPATIIDKLDDLPGDVAHYQVRSTCHRNGHLIIHQADRPQAPFILAVIDNNKIELPGWIYGHEAQHLGELRDHGDRWVHQNKLHPMDRLP